MQTNVHLSLGPPPRIIIAPKNIFTLPVPQIFSVPALRGWYLQSPKGSEHQVFHFIDKKSEAQRGKGTDPGSPRSL